MKTLRLAGWLLSAAVFAGGLVACSDDDDGDNKGGNSGNFGKLEWVDLGLTSGIKWASCNLGAENPWDYGDYYAWGDTVTKESYPWDNCATNNKALATLKSEGYIDDNGNLTAAHDVATVKLGAGARMPTMTQIRELISECATEWVTNYNETGVSGRLVTGPNKNTIFFPSAGYRYGLSLRYTGSNGSYWSATAYDDSYIAGSLSFYSDGFDWDYISRSLGFPVRPVAE